VTSNPLEEPKKGNAVHAANAGNAAMGKRKARRVAGGGRPQHGNWFTTTSEDRQATRNVVEASGKKVVCRL